MSRRAALRAATVGAQKKFANELVEVGEVKFEVRQPTIAARSAILKAAKAQSGDNDRVDLAALQVEALLRCVFVPAGEEQAGELVFEEADRASLLEQPTGGFVDTLAEVALRLLNVDKEDLEKN